MRFVQVAEPKFLMSNLDFVIDAALNCSQAHQYKFNKSMNDQR